MKLSKFTYKNGIKDQNFFDLENLFFKTIQHDHIHQLNHLKLLKYDN